MPSTYHVLLPEALLIYYASLRLASSISAWVMVTTTLASELVLLESEESEELSKMSSDED